MKINLEKTVPEAIQELIGTGGIFHIRWKKKDRQEFLENPFRKICLCSNKLLRIWCYI